MKRLQDGRMVDLKLRTAHEMAAELSVSVAAVCDVIVSKQLIPFDVRNSDARYGEGAFNIVRSLLKSHREEALPLSCSVATESGDPGIGLSAEVWPGDSPPSAPSTATIQCPHCGESITVKLKVTE